jgi:uncharacterized protein YcgL (UPF0745 family)
MRLNGRIIMSGLDIVFMEVGAKIRILKGKHKGSWGYVEKVSQQFLLVKCQVYTSSKAKGDNEDVVVEKVVRAKRDFVEVIPDTVFEMPDEAELIPVFDMPQEGDLSQADKELVQKILDEMPPPKNDDDILSQHSDEDEPIDISNILPDIDESLKIQHDNDTLHNRVLELEDALQRAGIEKEELEQSVHMFCQTSEYIRGRLAWLGQNA